MQKERPILFSTDTVKAILEGRKTMTRRIVSKNNSNHEDLWGYKFSDLDFSTAKPDSFFAPCYLKVDLPIMTTRHRVYPKYQIGDLLWVKETFYYDVISHPEGGYLEQYLFKADYTSPTGTVKWKPSLFMPKEAARIWLEVLDVRVERLQNISEEDAESEGILIDDEGLMCFDYVANCFRDITPKESFKSLWIKINGEESWNQNVWVWVISFKVLSKTGKKNILINE